MAKKPLRIADALGFGSSAKPYVSPYLREVSKIKPGQKLPGTITRAPRPSAATELAQLLTPNTRFGNELAAKIAPAVEMSPLGFLTGLVDARRAYQAGNVGNAASTGILAALGAVPGGKAAKVAKDVADTAAERGIIAYHGSPHSFDRFDISKIGTGEGAQAYGHGLYFAEAEEVAKKYRDELSGRVKSSANRLLAKNENIDDAISEAQSEIDRLMSLPNGGGDVFRRDGLVAIKKAAIDELSARKRGGGVGGGSMYQVRINANPEDFIDWDTVLSGQNQKVRELLGESDLLAAADRLSLASRNPMFAGDIIKADKATPAELSQALAGMGIPGIRYKDAGTRGMENATRNYVVFNDALIEILKKYGIAIPALAGGGLLATQPQQDGGL
jgi:hypothetical protein